MTVCDGRTISSRRPSGCERPLPVQVDGELLGEFDLLELGVVRDAARLLV